MYERKKARKRNAEQTRVRTTAPLRVRRAHCTARSPLGVPPRLCANGTIHPKAQPGPGFVTQRPKRGRSPRQPLWHFQRCTSRAGHSAGRLMPRPPGSDGDEPPPAGTASRSPLARVIDPASLYASEIERPFLKTETRCQSVSICSNKSGRYEMRPETAFDKFENKDLQKPFLCRRIKGLCA